MKIALVAPLVEPYTGASQIQFASLVKGLFARGHSITLFAHHTFAVPEVPIEYIPISPGIRSHRSSEVQTKDACGPASMEHVQLFLEIFLRLQARKADFDVIHAHAFSWPAFAFSSLIADVPIIHTLQHAATDTDINEELRILHQHQHPLTLVAISQAHARTFHPSIDKVIYNGVDVNVIPFAAQVDVHAPLLFTGPIAPEKGVEEAIEIACRANQPLLLVGNLHDQEYYEQQVLPLLRRDDTLVQYSGEVDRPSLWKLIGQARGLLFPAQWDEACGLSPLEAMAAGTPVIAFQHSAVEETILHGKTGFLVPPHDLAQAALFVQKLHTLQRRDCREHIERHFSLEHMLEQYEQLYAHICNKMQIRL